MSTNATQSPSETSKKVSSMLTATVKNAENSVTDAATRLAQKIEHAFNLARASELPEELRAVVDRIPEGCNVGTFVEASIDACGVAGCGGPNQAAWMPAVVDKPETRVYQGAPDLLSQFVAASTTALSIMGREGYADSMKHATPEQALALASEEAAHHAARLDKADPVQELFAGLWEGMELEQEADLRGVRGEQPAKVLVGGMVQWGVRRSPKGTLLEKAWPWANPAASLPVYSLVGAFLDEWNRAVVFGKHQFHMGNGAHSKYARATADMAAALGALALTAAREHDDYVTAAAGECERPEKLWEEHISQRINEQRLLAWVHLVWKEAAGCMKEEQAKCWERVQYFYGFRMKRGIEARPTHEQLRELNSQAYKHTYMMRMEVGPECEGLAGIDPVDILRRDAKKGSGQAMAGLAELHFTDEAIAEGEKADTHWVLAEALDNQWRICVARAEYDRSCVSPYPTKDVDVLHASRLYGRFPRAQGWAPVETKDARELGMGLYTRYVCANCAKWAPEAPVCPGCKSIRFCSDQCRKEALAGPMKAHCVDSSSCSNTLWHQMYCDGSKLFGEPKNLVKFVFPTAVNIYKVNVNHAIQMLGEHGMTNMNVLVHCTRRIDMGRDEISQEGAQLLLATCTGAAEAMRNRECMKYVHFLQWLPLFWTLFAPCYKRPCKEAVCEMIRTPRQFATQFFELVVSWAPVLLTCVQPVHALSRNRSAPNPTHNVPIFVMTTLWGMLRHDQFQSGLRTAFWDGMGRQLTNALMVVLLSLENHECRLEHNLRNLPDVILRVLHHLSCIVQVQPTFNQVQRSVHAIGRCGWSRTRSRLASQWVRSVRLAHSQVEGTAMQAEWKALQDTVDHPDRTYYDKFEFPPGHGGDRQAKRSRADNWVARLGEPPDTLGAQGDPEHDNNQSDCEEDCRTERRRRSNRQCKTDSETVRAGSKNARKRQAARAIQRAWMRRQVLKKGHAAVASSSDRKTRVYQGASEPCGTRPSFGGCAGAVYRPNEWIDIVAPTWDAASMRTYRDFKASYFGRTLNTHMADRALPTLKLA